MVPLSAHGESAPALAGRTAWLLAAWAVFSLGAAAVVAIWFRARARANERLSAGIRRDDWLAASGADPASGADGAPAPDRAE